MLRFAHILNLAADIFHKFNDFDHVVILVDFYHQDGNNFQEAMEKVTLPLLLNGDYISLADVIPPACGAPQV